MTAEESCRQVLKSIADACDQESLARAGGYLFRYVQEETVLRDCGQRGVCRTPPGCARHWEERNRELVRENDVLRSNSDHLSSENAALSSQVDSMAMRIESLAEELAKPEDVRLREVLDALEGRAVIFDGLGARVGHLLDEMDEWIERAGAAERRLKKAEEVVMLARQLTAYAWEDRLEDSKVSDDAKHDSRELGTAVWLYDQGGRNLFSRNGRYRSRRHWSGTHRFYWRRSRCVDWGWWFLISHKKRFRISRCLTRQKM
jgi:hypothetical protein